MVCFGGKGGTAGTGGGGGGGGGGTCSIVCTGGSGGGGGSFCFVVWANAKAQANKARTPSEIFFFIHVLSIKMWLIGFSTTF